MRSFLRRQHTVRPLNALEGETFHRTVVPRPLRRPGLCSHLRTSQHRWRDAKNFLVLAGPVQERGVIEYRVLLAGARVGEVVRGAEVWVRVDGGGRGCVALAHALRADVFAPTRGTPFDKVTRRRACVFMSVCMYICVCLCLYTCIYVCVFMSVCMYMRVCVYVCMHVHVCVFMHLYVPGTLSVEHRVNRSQAIAASTVALTLTPNIPIAVIIASLQPSP